MKTRRTIFAALLLTTAVSSVASAAYESDLYASLRFGVANTKVGDESNTNVVSRYSRIGFKGSTDLGNGLKGFGHYEYEVNGVVTDDIDDRTRLGYVGIEGGFGKILVGQNYHTFYNFIVGPADIPWDYSGFALVTYQGRTSESLTYAGDFGPVSVGASLRFDSDREAEDLDDIELGASYQAGPIKIGLGYISKQADEEDNILGVALSGNAGPVALAAHYQSQDDDSSIALNASAYNFYAHYEALSRDAGAEPSLITLGYTLGLGKNTSMWIEAASFDSDDGTGDADIESFQVILKYDIK